MPFDTPAARLKWARERHGRYRNPTDAARAFGWNVSTYLGHENGSRIPKRSAAIKYSRVYGVRWEWILEGDGPPTNRPQDARLGFGEPKQRYSAESKSLQEILNGIRAVLDQGVKQPGSEDRDALDAIWPRLTPAERQEALRHMEWLLSKPRPGRRRA